METNTTVVAPAPVAAPVTEPAPAPQADAGVKVEAPDNTVKIGDLMAQKNAAPKDGSGTPKAPETTPAPTPEPAKDGKPAEPAPQSQKDIDAALGKRMEAERKKWEKAHAEDLALAQRVRAANPGKTAQELSEQFVAEQAAALGISPELSKLLDEKGLFGNGTQKPKEMADFTDEEKDEAADRIGGQADEIVKLDPNFDLAAFVEQHPEKLAALTRGDISLMGLYLEQNYTTLLKAARDEGYAAGQDATVENIKNRNNQVPNPQSPSAPASQSTDYSKMPKKVWDEQQKVIKEAMARGERVSLT
jgi:hypothetical protein